MRTAVYNVLNNDATLLSILTGGVHNGLKLSRQETPTAFDSNGELLPCAVLKLSNEAPSGPYDSSLALEFNVYLYQRSGYDAIEEALSRIFSLLHRQKVTPQSGTCWEIFSTNTVLGMWDDVIDASLSIMRFRAMWERS